MADGGGGKFGNRFKQTAGQVRKEIEFKNALMRHLAEKCTAVENESSNSEDELTAKEGLQIEASRDELVAQLEADSETRKYRERQAISHVVRNQHLELLLCRSLQEVRQKRKEAKDQEETATDDHSMSEAAKSDSTIGSPPINELDQMVLNDTAGEGVPGETADDPILPKERSDEEINENPACDKTPDSAEACKDDVGDGSGADCGLVASSNRTAPALFGNRRAASVEEGQRAPRIKLSQTRNNSFGKTPTPPNSAPVNKTQRFDYV